MPERPVGAMVRIGQNRPDHTLGRDNQRDVGGSRDDLPHQIWGDGREPCHWSCCRDQELSRNHHCPCPRAARRKISVILHDDALGRSGLPAETAPSPQCAPPDRGRSSRNPRRLRPSAAPPREGRHRPPEPASPADRRRAASRPADATHQAARYVRSRSSPHRTPACADSSMTSRRPGPSRRQTASPMRRNCPVATIAPSVWSWRSGTIISTVRGPPTRLASPPRGRSPAPAPATAPCRWSHQQIPCGRRPSPTQTARCGGNVDFGHRGGRHASRRKARRLLSCRSSCRDSLRPASQRILAQGRTCPAASVNKHIEDLAAKDAMGSPLRKAGLAVPPECHSW